MPAWLLGIFKMIASLLVEKLVVAIKDYAKEKYEERKTNQEVKQAVKELREAQSENDIRSAIRKLLP
jgi:formate-dependent nitrite reductase cytochrome c552 subunit